MDSKYSQIMPRVLKYAQKIVFNKFSFKKISFQHKHEKNKIQNLFKFQFEAIRCSIEFI
jgi:hypothetical protein